MVKGLDRNGGIGYIWGKNVNGQGLLINEGIGVWQAVRPSYGSASGISE
jgi:hypothetical protein